MAKSLLSFNISNLTLDGFFETFNRGTTTIIIIIFETLKVKIYSSKLFKGATLIPDSIQTGILKLSRGKISSSRLFLFIQFVGRIISFASVV